MTTRLADVVKEDLMCPFLAAVVNDQLWQRPSGVYCARPDARVRAPARSTLTRVCTTRAYVTCAGYRATAGAGMPPRPAGSDATHEERHDEE
jgi:hypothetical protein